MLSITRLSPGVASRIAAEVAPDVSPELLPAVSSETASAFAARLSPAEPISSAPPSAIWHAAAPASLTAHPRLQAALTAMQRGVPVVLLDDDDRENEADLILAAERLTDATMAQLIRDGSGIVCLCLTPETANQLALPPMVAHNESAHGTAFTVSIEARHGVSTGVSAHDRLTTIAAAIAPNAQPHDLVRPGHVFPLRAHPGGVRARQGHTEGAVYLAALAGLRPLGVLCELMNPDGTMTRGQQVLDYARQHGLPLLTLAELVAYADAVAAAVAAAAAEAPAR